MPICQNFNYREVYPNYGNGVYIEKFGKILVLKDTREDKYSNSVNHSKRQFYVRVTHEEENDECWPVQHRKFFQCFCNLYGIL